MPHLGQVGSCWGWEQGRLGSCARAGWPQTSQNIACSRQQSNLQPRQPGHNSVLTFFGTAFEAFQGAMKRVMAKFKSVLPEGSLRARIRVTRRETGRAQLQQVDGQLQDTLGQEACGMIVVDAEGMPMKYDMLNVCSDVVGRQMSRMELDVPCESGRGWKRSGAHLDVDQEAEFDEKWQTDLREGARFLLQETWVPANDPHLDAKVFPCIHPYGTGSLLAEPGSGAGLCVQIWLRCLGL